jgi:hypothetical protein
MHPRSGAMLKYQRPQNRVPLETLEGIIMMNHQEIDPEMACTTLVAGYLYLGADSQMVFSCCSKL